MIRFLCVLGVVSLSIGGSQARADEPYQSPFLSGSSFDRQCDKPRYSTQCLAFTQGAVEGFGLLATKKILCLPPEVDNGQLMDVGRKFIRDNPAKAHLGATLLLANAWATAFPCPNKK
jgi:hypothetical protein